MELSWDGQTLTWGSEHVRGDQIRGFAERYGGWSGRAWLEVRGPGWRVPIRPGYAHIRAALRAWFPDRAFEASWADGRFPPASLGLPPRPVLVVGALATLSMAVGVGWTLGPVAGAGVALAASWPLSRLRDGVGVFARGLRVGPTWAPLVSWHEVEAVYCRKGRRAARVWCRTRRGGGVGTVPVVLLPALRARLRRLGALELEESEEGTDATYDRWRAPATGIPWGLLAGTVVAAWIAPAPWVALAAGLMALAATALLSAAVEARATGWAFGGVFWTTAAYAVVLAAVAVGWSGWLTPG